MPKGSAFRTAKTARKALFLCGSGFGFRSMASCKARQKPQVGRRYHRHGWHLRKKARSIGKRPCHRQQNDHGKQRRKRYAQRAGGAAPACYPEEKAVKTHGGHGLGRVWSQAKQSKATRSGQPLQRHTQQQRRRQIDYHRQPCAVPWKRQRGAQRNQRHRDRLRQPSAHVPQPRP